MEPLEAGEIRFRVPLESVSFQAPRAKKDIITSAVRAALGNLGFLFTADVELTIEWLLMERRRYQDPHSPDPDNVIKPIQDAISGRRES